VLAFAPRYPPELLELIAGLDDGSGSLAETCRRIGGAAENLGLLRPSYVHVRRILLVQREERIRQDELRAAVRQALSDIATSAFSGGSPDVRPLLDALDELGR
jgi:hypothetical protein